MTILEHIPYFIDRKTKIKPYWEGMNNGEFKTTQCKKCSEIHFPPRTLCVKCYSTDLEWINLPLNGTIQSFTYVSIPPAGFNEPYYLAEVVIDKLKKPILGRLISDKTPAIGDRVSIDFEDIDPDQAVIVFKL